MSAPLTHLDEKGAARMVDVSAKAITQRRAVATGRIIMLAETFALVETGLAKKGDVLAVARIAGIQAAKQTTALIPLCHTLLLTSVAVDFALNKSWPGIDVTATVTTQGQTGAEMEALTAASIACLTLYDMLKATDKSMRIEGLRLVAKSGGKSGDFQADDFQVNDFASDHFASGMTP